MSQKDSNDGNYPKLYNTKHFQQAVDKTNTWQYPVCIKFPRQHILKFSCYDVCQQWIIV